MKHIGDYEKANADLYQALDKLGKVLKDMRLFLKKWRKSNDGKQMGRKD